MADWLNREQRRLYHLGIENAEKLHDRKRKLRTSRTGIFIFVFFIPFPSNVFITRLSLSDEESLSLTSSVAIAICHSDICQGRR